MKRLFFETREEQVFTALTIDGKLREIYIDPAHGSLVGQIILGRLDAILPGQFAFVDIGTGKNALMNVTHAIPLKKGQPVLVQVYKDPTGSKGAYTGMELRHKGHYAILFESPRSEIGISQKITNEKERNRLRELARDALPKGFGIIIRTNSEGQDADKISTDINNLYLLHQRIKTRAEHSVFPAVIFPEPGEVMALPSLLPDIISNDLQEIWVSGFDFEAVKQAIVEKMPIMEDHVFQHKSESQSLLDAHNITTQIFAALKKTVQLPCGGFITIEQTEACVVVDVNTGRYTGQNDFRQTVLKTNLEAAACIAWQLALRNLSGIIIVDFIDMKYEEDKSALLDAFSKELKADRIKTEIVSITELGLVQLTRKRTREPLSRILEQDCPNCNGKGRVQTNS